MNIAIVSIVLRDFCRPFLRTLEEEFHTPEQKLEAVLNQASDDGNEEIVQMCYWIERNGLTRTFFPEVEVE